MYIQVEVNGKLTDKMEIVDYKYGHSERLGNYIQVQYKNDLRWGLFLLSKYTVTIGE